MSGVARRSRAASTCLGNPARFTWPILQGIFDTHEIGEIAQCSSKTRANVSDAEPAIEAQWKQECEPIESHWNKAAGREKLVTESCKPSYGIDPRYSAIHHR